MHLLKSSRIIILAMLIITILSTNLIAASTYDYNGSYATMAYADFVIGGSGSMTVSAPYAAGVSPSNVNSNRYSLDTSAKRIHWTLDLTNLSIGGTRTNAFITIQLPESKQSNVTVTVPCLAQDAGGAWQTCYVIATEWSGTLLVRLSSESNWSASSSTRLNINLILEYRDPQ